MNVKLFWFCYAGGSKKKMTKNEEDQAWIAVPHFLCTSWTFAGLYERNIIIWITQVQHSVFNLLALQYKVCISLWIKQVNKCPVALYGQLPKPNGLFPFTGVCQDRGIHLLCATCEKWKLCLDLRVCLRATSPTSKQPTSKHHPAASA